MSALTGTGTLLRLAARRDRVLLTLSALALTAFSVGSAQATVELYPDAAAARRDLGAVLASPVTLAMYGPAATSSIEGLSIFKTLLLGAVVVGLLASAVVRRHTRVEEEDGRVELLGASVVGRQAPLAAAMTLAALATLLVSAASAVGLAAIGFDPRGSVAFAVAWTVGGLVMTGVTALACQLTASARAASGWALGTLGVLYVVRGLGDTATSDAGRALGWLSPLGWVSRVEPYGADRLWVLAPALALTALLVAAAAALLERRDLGSGVLASRPGRARAARSLASTPALVWRLTRASLLGWLVGFVALGVVLGSFVGMVEGMLADPAVRDLLARMGGAGSGAVRSLTELYLATELRFAAGIASAAGVAVAMRLAAEERAGRGELVLATATSRARWLTSYAVCALAAPTLLLLALAAVVGARGHADLAAAPTAGATVAAATQAVPAMWVVIAGSLLLAALGPRWAPWAWGLLAVAFLVGELGSTMGLPEALVRLSPYAHMPLLPFGTWEWATLGALTAVAAALLAGAAAAYRRRDVT